MSHSSSHVGLLNTPADMSIHPRYGIPHQTYLQSLHNLAATANHPPQPTSLPGRQAADPNSKRSKSKARKLAAAARSNPYTPPHHNPPANHYQQPHTHHANIANTRTASLQAIFGTPPTSAPPTQQFQTSMHAPSHAHLYCPIHGWTTSHGLPAHGPYVGAPCRVLAEDPGKYTMAFKSLRAPTPTEGSQRMWKVNASLSLSILPSSPPNPDKFVLPPPPPQPPTSPPNPPTFLPPPPPTQ